MKPHLKATLLAAALALAPLAALPAGAQEMDISFNAFHDVLANYGDWVYSDRWGEVWIPADVGPDWRPYSYGHWDYTQDYGWLWVSDEGDWGDIVYHYGRWVYDPDDGWMWIPGYVWGPAWVVWRSNDDYAGWMPMPPDDAFLGGGFSLSFGSDWDDVRDHFGYSRWYGRDFDDDRFRRMWVFVPVGHLGDRDYRRHAETGPRVMDFIHQSHNVTRYSVINNVVVNRSVDADLVHRAGGHFETVRAHDVLRRPDLIATVDRGRDVQMRMRSIAPHGHGMADSAPRLNDAQLSGLSDHPAFHGRQPVHLFSRTTASERFHGETGGAAGAVMNGPGAPVGSEMRHGHEHGPEGQPPTGMQGQFAPGGMEGGALHERRHEAPTSGMQDRFGPGGMEGAPAHTHEHRMEGPPPGATPDQLAPGGMEGGTPHIHEHHMEGPPPSSGMGIDQGPAMQEHGHHDQGPMPGAAPIERPPMHEQAPADHGEAHAPPPDRGDQGAGPQPRGDDHGGHDKGQPR